MWTEKQVHFILLLVDQFGCTLMTLYDPASSTPARALPAEADFLPPLQRDRKVSLERQLVQALRAAIVSGRLRPGMRLPSSRCLAAELHINRNTIVNALEQLIAEDYLTGKVGAGTFVNHHLLVSSPVPMPSPSIEHARWLRPIPEPQVAPPATDMLEFRVCQPSTAAFPLAAWRKSWHSALRQLPPDDYSAIAGEPGLRAAVANYLVSARGLNCSSEDILITSGALQGIHLIAQATLAPGSTVAFEEPGYPQARQAFESRFAHIIPIPVDKDGLCVERLPNGPTAPVLVYVTPSHQFPLGVRMSIPRRLALLEWARRNDALILEDDYDSEFRYDAPPLPALTSLDTSGRVAYLGTFSKVLSPSLRVGYVRATPPLQKRLERLKCMTDYHTSTPLQLALEAFMRDGSFHQHIRRMRRIYAEKRAALEQALSPLKSTASFLGLEAGLHVCIEFDPQVQISTLIQESLKRRILITNMAQYYFAQPDRQGLVLGYGGLELRDIEWAGKQLVSILQQKNS
jgi:GntR family transcriptional regulator/MocR family aminotransferase